MNIKTKFSVVIVSLMITMNIAIAANTVQLGTNRVGLYVAPVDDQITCSLNGRVIVQSNFGDPGKDIELTSQLVPGGNSVHCVAIDNSGGSCFSYAYQI